MTTRQIETERVAGDITLILKHGTDAERQSLFRLFEQLEGPERRCEIEQWVADGMPGA